MDKGRVLSGRYELMEQVGSGGFGAVFRAKDRKTGRIVAVKALHAHLASEEAYLKRLHREVIIAKALSSDHAVKVLASGNDAGVAYTVMEYVDGMTLRDVLNRDGVLSPQDALEVSLQTAEALRDAHDKGIVHRDVKPQNIFITAAGVKLGDFGIARADDVIPLTMHTGYLGTVAYGSPEQVRGEEPDARSDIYSLGIVLYEMLAGRPPFRGSPLAIMDAHLNQAPEPIPNLPAPLNSIVTRCLAKELEDRFQTAGDLCQALRPLVAPDEDGTLVADQATIARPSVRSKMSGPTDTTIKGRERPPSSHRGAPPRGEPPSLTGAGDHGGWSRYRFWMISLSLLGVGLLAGAIGIALMLSGQGNGSDNEGVIAVVGTSTPTPILFPEIAYVNSVDGNIWLLNPDSPETQTQVTTTGDAEHPAWSQDGKRLAYIRDLGAESQVWIWDGTKPSEAQHELLIGNTGSLIRGVVWEPGGQSVLYHQVHGPELSGSHIHRHSLSSPPDDSQDLTILWGSDVETIDPSLRGLLVSGFDLAGQGNRMFVEIDIPNVVGGCGVWTMEFSPEKSTTDASTPPSAEPTAAPSRVRDLLPVSAETCFGLPASSPDGDRIAFYSYPGGGIGGVEVVDESGLRLGGFIDTLLQGVDDHPFWPKIAWSPDGTKFIYEKLEGEEDHLYMHNTVDGTTLWLPVQGRHPAWSYSGGSTP